MISLERQAFSTFWPPFNLGCSWHTLSTMAVSTMAVSCQRCTAARGLYCIIHTIFAIVVSASYLCQVQRFPALARIEPHPPGQVPLGQMQGPGVQVEPSTPPKHPQPTEVPGQWAGPLLLAPSKGAFPSLVGLVPNCPLAMALDKVKLFWISLRL